MAEAIRLPSGRAIGEGHAPFIICEIGSNWQTLEDCRNSIVQAKACGADAVKFQAYTADALYGANPGGYLEHFGKVNQGALPLEWLPNLKAKADSVGIELMCSAFSPGLVDAVNPFVSIHKVASAECTHLRMLERLAKIGKPVLLSTGAHGLEDIGAALSVLKATPTVLLYCVAAYPAREVDFGCMEALSVQFNRLVGYSDHSTDALHLPQLAAASGAHVIEKHVTFISAATPDSPHSLDAREFQHMVDYLRGKRTTRVGPTPAERPMLLRHNRRLIATQDIAAGAKLTEGENFGIYRSLKDDTHAFHPFMVDEVTGKPAKRAIRAGDGIGPGDV